MFAVTVLLTAIASPVLATDYAQPPRYSVPSYSTTEISGTAFLNAIKSNSTSSFNIASDARLGEDVLKAIQGTDKTVVLNASDYSITINGKNVESAKALNLKMSIAVEDGKLVVTPAQKGDFFAQITVTVPKSKLPEGLVRGAAKVFYVGDDGTRTDQGFVRFNANGSVSFDISHASHYEIVNTDISVTIDPNVIQGNTTENPNPSTNPETPGNTGNPNTADNNALPLAGGIFVAAVAAALYLNKKRSQA